MESIDERSLLSNMVAKAEAIERKKKEIREKVEAQLGRVEQGSTRLATIRKEVESLEVADPMKKDVEIVCKKIRVLNKELNPLSRSVHKKENEYREALDAYKEKEQLLCMLVKSVEQSERLSMQKLDELSQAIESTHIH